MNQEENVKNVIIMTLDFMVLSYIGFGLAQSKDGSSPYFLKLLQPFLEE